MSNTMDVLVVVSFPDLATATSEEAWEKDIVNAVRAAVRADKQLKVLAVKRLEHEDCNWVFELGMPMPKFDLTVHDDGSWHSGLRLAPTADEISGHNLQSLFDYLIDKGFVNRGFMDVPKSGLIDLFQVLIVPAASVALILRAEEPTIIPTSGDATIRLIGSATDAEAGFQKDIFTKKSRASVVRNLRVLANKIEKSLE